MTPASKTSEARPPAPARSWQKVVAQYQRPNVARSLEQVATSIIPYMLAWYLTYRRPKADCEDGSCARPPGKTARFSLWLGTLVALGAAIYPALPAANHQINTAAVSASDAKLSVLIPSMDCPPCAAGIEATLSRAPGVKQAAVNYDTKAAVLVYDPAVTSRDKLLALIDASGFPAERSTVK